MRAAESSTELASRDAWTPMRPRSCSSVPTSRRRGTFDSRSGSSVSSAAHMMGSAAFLAPETLSSPESGRPPVMTSLSTALAALRRPLRGSKRHHRERVDFLAHAIAERRVDELVPLHAALALERRAHDQRLEMLAVAGDA